MTIAEATANRIKGLCEERGITLNKLATLSKISQSTLNEIIHGKSKHPRISTLKKLSDGLNITLSDFFNDKMFDSIEDS